MELAQSLASKSLEPGPRRNLTLFQNLKGLTCAALEFPSLHEQTYEPSKEKNTFQNLVLQVAKAAAMGPRHDETLLEEAISNPYLSAVKRDAASARKAGWFWELPIV